MAGAAAEGRGGAIAPAGLLTGVAPVLAREEGEGEVTPAGVEEVEVLGAVPAAGDVAPAGWPP